MRTEPANCGSGSVIMAKSRQDVEAAFAIAQLSERQPRGIDCGLRTTSSYIGDSQSNVCGSPPRFSHLRTAVMPLTSSRVERAAGVKRRLDWQADNVNKQARLDEVQRAIESERDSFISTKRHHHVLSTTADTADDHELVGRFIRTCGPSGPRDDGMESHELYVKVRHESARPTPSLFTSGSGEGERVIEDSRRSVLSAVSDGSHLEPSVLRRLTGCTQPYHHSDELPFHHQPTSKHYLLPEDHRQRHSRVVGPMSYDDKKLSGGSRLKCEDGIMSRGDRSSLVSAYYSLGQSAAAAAASQLLFVKPPRCSTTLSAASVHQSHVPQRRRHVDSCTLRKVRQGQFGVLSTLRSYCSQLRRHSEPTDVVTQSSVVDDDSEVAMDLSVRKSSSSGVAGSGGWFRSSRSCGSSPSVRLDDELSSERRLTVGEVSSAAADRRRLQLMVSSISLPSSPYTARQEDLTRRHMDHASRTETSVSHDVSEVTVPDCRLPLKKRWLYNHQHQDQQQQQAALCVINEVDADRPRLSATGSCDNVRRG